MSALPVGTLAKHRPNSVGQATDVDLGLPGATFNSTVENSTASAVSRAISVAGPEVGTLEARTKKLHFLEGSAPSVQRDAEFPAEDAFD